MNSIVFICFLLLAIIQGCQSIDGASLGQKLGDLGEAEVFLANETLIQIRGLQTSINETTNILFNYLPPDHLYLRYTDARIDREVLAEIDSLSGLNDSVVVMTIPEHALLLENASSISFKSEFFNSTLTLPKAVQFPTSFVLPTQFESQDIEYSDITSGNITVLSEGSLRIEQLIYHGTILSDPYIVVGKRSEVIWDKNPNKAHKCFIRGYDDNRRPLPLKVDYYIEDITVDLPSGLTITDIDFISIYEMRFTKHLSTVYIDVALPYLPAYIPPIINSPDLMEPWPTDAVYPIYNNEFHVTVGHPGGRPGYIGQNGLVPNNLVFYINDVIAPTLIVEAGKIYIFKIAGGYRYKLYITNQPSGGYNLINDPKLINHRMIAQQTEDASKLCIYGYPSAEGFLGLPENLPEPKDFSDFSSFKRRVLRLDCEKVPTGSDDSWSWESSRARSAVMKWTAPVGDEEALYYGALDYENMGARIIITNEIDNLDLLNSVNLNV